MNICTSNRDMQSDSKRLFIFLIIIWSIFIVGQLKIYEITTTLQSSSFRFDLLLLPILLFVTGYAIYNIMKNEKPKNKS